jgi:hypothetical protein
MKSRITTALMNCARSFRDFPRIRKSGCFPISHPSLRNPVRIPAVAAVLPATSLSTDQRVAAVSTRSMVNFLSQPVVKIVGVRRWILGPVVLSGQAPILLGASPMPRALRSCPNGRRCGTTPSACRCNRAATAGRGPSCPAGSGESPEPRRIRGTRQGFAPGPARACQSHSCQPRAEPRSCVLGRSRTR